MRRFKRTRFLMRTGVLYSLAISMVILFVGGFGFWVLDPRVHTLADGLWLAFTTAATVGYGDMVPSTHASRAFAVVVVLLGLAVRFIHFALFEGTLFTLHYYLVDVAVLLVAAILGWRNERAAAMARQYAFAFEKTGPFSWRRKTA